MDYIWVMTKSYDALSGENLPVAWNYGLNHSTHGFKPNGWGLAWVSALQQHLDFMKSGTDPEVEVVGKEDDPPTQLLLDTYANELGPGPYSTLKAVLKKLAETEPRFLMDRDPRRP